MDELDTLDTIVYIQDWLEWRHTFYVERGW